MHDMVTCDCFWRLPDTSLRKAHFQMLKLYQPVRCRLIFFMLLRLIYYFTFQPRNESHFWEQDKTKCVGLPTLIVVIIIMLIEKRKKRKQNWKKLTQATVEKQFHKSTAEVQMYLSVCLSVIPSKMQPNLQTLLNMTNSRFVHVKESFPAGKRESALQVLRTSHLCFPQKAQNCRKLKDLWVVVNCSRTRVGN